MIFRQLFDQVSCTYSYLLASRHGGEALIIDPVLEKVDRYLQLLRELDLRLVKAVDTHLHADHITGLGALRDKTQCITVMGQQTKADVDEIARRGWAVTAEQARTLATRPDVALVDLRERSERERHGTIPDSLHVPYTALQENIAEGGMLNELAKSTGKRLLLYCAFGERSAMAVQAAQDAGLTSACHIQGGIDAWKNAMSQVMR